MLLNLNCRTCFRKSRFNDIKEYILHEINKDWILSVFDVAEEGDEEYCCCGKLIRPGNLYISEDRFLPIAIDIIATHLSNKIEYCSHCEGKYMKDYIMKYFASNDEEDDEYLIDEEKINSILNLGEEMKNLFDRPVGNYRIENMIIKHLRCKNCGYGYNRDDLYDPHATYFDPSDKAFSQNDIDEFYKLVDFNNINNFAEYYGVKISVDELNEFEQYLYEFPLLAYKHPVGKKIYEMLYLHYQSNDCEILPKNTLLFRGRLHSKGSKKYPPEQMWEPPKEKAAHGRYNTVGNSVLYCCNNIEFIPYEIYPNNYQSITIAKVVTQKDLEVLNINKLFEKFSGFIGEKADYDGIYNFKYVLTNYIAECCKEIGFKGVKYEGVKDGEYTNFAFFNYEKETDLKITETISVDVKISYSVSKEVS